MKGKFITFIYKISLLLCCLLFAQQGMTQTCDVSINESFDGETFGDLTGWTTVGTQGGTGNWVIDDDLISTVEPLGNPVPSDRLVIRDNTSAVNNSSLVRSADYSGFMGMAAVTLSFSYVYNDRPDGTNPNDYLELYISKIGETSLYWDGTDWVPGPVAWLQGADEVDDFLQPIPAVFYADNSPFKVRFNYEDGTQGGTGGGRGASIDDFTICGSLNCDFNISAVNSTPPLECDEKGTVQVNLSSTGTSPYTINLIGDGNPDYMSGSISSSTNLLIDQNVDIGNYSSLLVTDAIGCTATFAGPFDLDPSPFSNASLMEQNPSCGEDNGSITASPTGATYSYAWTGSSGTTETIDGLSDGTYSVTISDSATSCTTTMSTTLTDVGQAVEIMSIDILSEAGCDSTGLLIVDASSAGSTSYLWSNGSTSPANASLAPGTYTVTVSTNDGAYCQDTETIVLGAGSQPTISVTSQPEILCNGETVDVTVTTNSGVSPYSYSWSSGGTGTTQNLGAGTYTITVTDDKSCTDEIPVTLTEPQPLGIPQATVIPVSCGGESGGSITFPAMTGGTSPYTYTWDSGQDTKDISGIPAGDYTYTFSDANGCSISNTISVGEPLILSTSLIIDSILSCNAGSDGSLTATATGGTQPYNYTWSNSATTATITGLPAGDYSLTITDANGCTATNSAEITELDPLSGNFVVNNTASCEGIFDGSATVTVSGGTLPYTYTWSTPNGSGDTDNMITAGNHSITVTDANNCQFIINGTVPANEVITISNAQITSISCYGGNDGAINITISPTDSYTFDWSNDASTQNINNLSEGTYTIIVTNSAGCQTTETYDLQEPAEILLPLDPIYACEGGTFTIKPALAGNSGPYTYEWEDGSTADSLVLDFDETSTLTITDSKACQAEAFYAADNILPSPEDTPFCDKLEASVGLNQVNLDDFCTGVNSDYSWKINNPSNDCGISFSDNEGEEIEFIAAGSCDREVQLIPLLIYTINGQEYQCEGEPENFDITVTGECFVPEIITPNGDGKNDVWDISSYTAYDGSEYFIYNRNGHKVKSGIAEDTWQGDDVPDGIYWVVIKKDGNVLCKGAITKLSK